MTNTLALHDPTIETYWDSLQIRLSEERFDLPMLPGVIGAVLSITTDKDGDMVKLADLIQQDQSLASRVMKIANSPAYRGVNPMTSLQQAIARMGMDQISDIALAATIGAKVFKGKDYQSIVERLWSHSTASAAWSKEIARILRRNVEGAFMCGLLHQIGKPVVLQAISEIDRESGTELGTDNAITLIDAFHIPVGQLIGKSWHLPPAVLESISWHQDWHKAPNFTLEATVTAGANLLASEMLSERGITTEKLQSSKVMEDLNFYDEDLSKLVEQNDKVAGVLEAMSI